MEGSNDHSHARALTIAPGEAQGRKLIISILITTITLAAEVIGGLLTGSLALLSDAAHVFLDIFALVLSYGAIKLAAKAATSKHTYGFRRMKVLAAFANGTTLLVISIEIFRESAARFAHPASVIAGPMIVIAIIGLGANLIVALVLGRHDHKDLNTRAAFLHVLGDALSSLGVIIAGVLMLLTGWTWVDPTASVLIAIVILAGAWRVLREAIHILNEGSPEGANADEVSAAMAKVTGVREVHDLHIWTIEPGYPIMSAHILLEDRLLSETTAVMDDIKDIAAHRFGIEHITVQFECANCGQGSIAHVISSCAEEEST